MPGIDRERRQHRVDLGEEALAERGVMLGDLGVVDDLDALARQLAAELAVRRRVLRDQVHDAAPALGELLLRRRPIADRRHASEARRTPQARDPDLEELVEIRREDREELHAFQQRVPLVSRLVQDARVELDP